MTERQRWTARLSGKRTEERVEFEKLEMRGHERKDTKQDEDRKTGGRGRQRDRQNEERNSGGVRRQDGEDTRGEKCEPRAHAEQGPVPRRPYQSERRVEQRDHEIRDGQVNDEEAGGRVHSLVLEDDVTDQDVAKEREDDDEGVSHNEQGFHCGVLGLGPVAPPAHKVLPVGEGVVVPEEVRGVGHGQRHRQAWLVLPALGALRGSHQGEEDEQHPVLDHFAGATAPGTVPSGRPRWTARGRAGGRAWGEARGAVQGGTPGPLSARPSAC